MILDILGGGRSVLGIFSFDAFQVGGNAGVRMSWVDDVLVCKFGLIAHC